MPRVAKERRLRRKARRVRQRDHLAQFWGPDWQAAQDRFLLTLPTDRHMERGLRRMIRDARRRERAGMPPLVIKDDPLKGIADA